MPKPLLKLLHYHILARRASRKCDPQWIDHIDHEVHRACGSRPLLSVIIPSFNQGEYIGECINSLICPKPPWLEILIIDGGSTDNTLQVFAKYDHLIDYWCSEPDSGQANALNKGLQKARGKWISYQNSDDLYLPNALYSIAPYLLTSTYALIYGHSLQIWHDSSVKDFNVLNTFNLRDLSRAMPANNQSFFWNSALVPPDSFYFNENLRFCLDYEFLCRIYCQNHSALRVPLYLGAQRIHPMTKSSNLQHIHDIEFAAVNNTYFGDNIHLEPSYFRFTKKLCSIVYDIIKI